MAGIGVRLNRIFGKNTLTTSIIGFGYSTLISIAPMFLVIAAVFLMQVLLGFSKIGYAERELFSCTVLYIFIFALLVASPFNAVLSKYMSDVIYKEQFEDILPCFYVGLLLTIALGVLIGVPFCCWEYFMGGIPLSYVFVGYCGFISLILVFYAMLYLSICKDYNKISWFFFLGMLFTLLLSLVLVYVLQWNVTFSMLISLCAGFLLTAGLEIALVTCYFKENSGRYKEVLSYFGQYWKLVFTNFLYTLGLYVHNFVFWTTDMRMTVANSFVCMTSYDMATCLAMLTNLTSSVIFTARVEMHFHERYKAYSEAVIGGRWMDIENAKNRMFRQLSEEMSNLVRIQFIISVVLFFAFIILLPQFGFGGMVMRIFPCLAAGYFILFTMYAAIIFLYYFNDLSGALMTAVSFFSMTLVGSIVASRLPEIWYGMGLVTGAFTGWTVSYFRLRWLEKHLDVHIFCSGRLLKSGQGKQPDSKVFDRYQM
ncbi:MAG: exopolysaccharide Pel transporter PelG [Lachnospiraceae bacterium]|nr:exopolysaccharide Pel transporter PelG [Lachnospiraceae bacterium]